MFKTLRISNYYVIFALTLFFFTFFKTNLQGREQRKIISDLQSAVESCGLFYGCSFTLFDPDLPEHKEYYANLKARNIITKPLFDRLQELTPRGLYYFSEFKERLHITRIYAFNKKDMGDYCLLYTLQFYLKTQPWEKNAQRWYEKGASKCDEKYENFCVKINQLENFINESFLRYYSLGYSYNNCKLIYDHGLVQLANGNLENAVSLANDFLEQAKKENKDLKSISSEQLVNLGITYNEAMEYSKAIEFLNASIENNPSNKEAYFQRAISHLEKQEKYS